MHMPTWIEHLTRGVILQVKGIDTFCSQRCKFEWLEINMDNIEQGRPIEFIRHRRESQGGYEKVTDDTGYRSYTTIERIGVDNG